MDRFISFLLPVLFLQTIKSDEAYSAIEIVLSMSTILATFIDLGLKGFLLFSFSQSNSYSDTKFEAVNAVRVVLLIHIFSIFAYIALSEIGFASLGDPRLLILGILRASALSILGVVTQLCVVKGKVALAPAFSVLHSLPSFVFLVLPSTLTKENFVLAYFAPSIILVSGCFMYLAFTTKIETFRSATRYLKKCLTWSWPLIATAGLNMMVSNYAKIYSFSALPQNEMIGFIFWFRIFSIIQMTHVVVMMLLSVEIYASNGLSTLFKTLRKYSLLMLPVVFIVIVLLNANNYLKLSYPKMSSGSGALLTLYVLFWCYGAFLETYFSKESKNSRLLLAALISAGVYLAILYISDISNLTTLISTMLLSGTIYLLILAYWLRKVR